MATFEEFLNEKNITIKRKYTDTYPAKTVGHSARVRNKIIEALKDGKITVDEFNDIVASHSSSPKRWSRNNKRFFKIEEDGVSLSGYGRKILNNLVTESINENYEVIYSDGVSAMKKFSNERKARAFFYDKIRQKGMKNAAIYKADSGFHSTSQTEYVVAFWGDGSYLDNVSKKDAELAKKKVTESVDEGLNKSDVAYQLAIDYTGRTKPKITKLNKKRIQIKYGYKISPQKVIDSIKTVHPEVELKHVEWSDSMTGGGFHIFDILESTVTEARYDKKKLLKRLGDADDATIQTGDGKEYIIYNPNSNNKDNAAMWHDKSVFAVDQDGDEHEIDYKDIGLVMTESVNEARVSAKKLLQSVVKGETTSVEGIKLSKGFADGMIEWLGGSSYGRKFADLPFDKLFRAAFNWGIERYAKDYPGWRNELKDLKTKAKAMKESKIYESFSEFIINEKSIKDWFLANIDSFKDEKEYMKAGKKAGFSKKELETAMDDFEQGGEDYLEAYDKSVDEAKVNPSGYVKAGKLGYNDQFLGKRSLSYTLSVDLGMNPNHEFGGGDWLGFDHVSLYTSGGKKTGTILDDALTGKYTYAELKSAAAKFLGIKESVVNEAKFVKDFNRDVFLNESTEPKKKIHETFESFLDAELINEKLKSSKLRGLLSMKKGNANILKAIYGFSKIRLDQIKDEQIIDIDPKQGKKAEGLVVYYTTQEKENPYVDRSSNSSWTQAGNFKFQANTILGIGMGKDVAYMTHHYDRKSGKTAYSLTTNDKYSKGDIGINKKYRGWDSTGVYNVKRMIDLADAAFVINTTALPDSTDLRTKRGEQKRGATALMDPKEFKNQNMEKYKAILQQRASSLPIDDLVVGAIEEVAKIMADGVKKREVNKYGEFIMGTGADGRAYRISDLNNFTNNLMQDYERWAKAADTVANAKGGDDEEDTWAVKYYSDEMKKYAKEIKDRLGKLKKRNLAW